ncbi:MAG: sigma-70 family RNA polymerase sigma factor [Burkholderiales bacterium]|nr:sigma-70 family RNA polymerase sigma factor [Burkholderiales bacterium]
MSRGFRPHRDPAEDEAHACVTAAWRAHERELLGYLRRSLADADAADDLLQDVFVKAMRQGKDFCSLDNPRAWLFTVVRHKLIDRARTTHPTSPLSEDELANLALPEEPVAPVDALADCLARALGELSAPDAAILRACDLEGMTQRHFAEIHGLSLPAAKARLQRARQRLRDRIATACQLRFEADGSVAGHVPRPPAD